MRESHRLDSRCRRVQVIENESIKGINNFPTLVKFSHADKDTSGDGKPNAYLNVDDLGMY